MDSPNPTPKPRLPNPKRWQPKRLSQKHKAALTLWAQGVKPIDVAAATGVGQVSLNLLVLSDLGRAFLHGLEELMDSRLKNMYTLSVDAIEDQLRNGSGENKLKAATLQMKATGKLGKGDEERESAEDVIQRIFQINGNVNIQVNQKVEEDANT